MFKLGIVLIFVGMILALVAILLPILQLPLGQPSVSGAWCVLVGFIPLCFGMGEFPAQLVMITLALALVLVVISIVFFIYSTKRAKEVISLHTT